MRYHWGLGIGHTYSHGRDVRSQRYPAPTTADDLEVIQEEVPEFREEIPVPGCVTTGSRVDGDPDDVSEPDNSEEIEEPNVDYDSAEGDSATDDDTDDDESDKES